MLQADTFLSDQERDLLRWAANSSTIQAPANASSREYKQASAVEVLVRRWCMVAGVGATLARGGLLAACGLGVGGMAICMRGVAIRAAALLLCLLGTMQPAHPILRTRTCCLLVHTRRRTCI